MLPSTKSSEDPDPGLVEPSSVSPVGAPPERAAVVFRVARLPSGGWQLETSGGEVGGFFASKHAALTYACAEAEYCPAKSVVIELAERRVEPSGPELEARALALRPAATGT